MTGGDNFLNKYRHMKEEKINKLSDEMILALAYELQFSAMKRLNAMYGECDTLVNEGTPEEDIVTDEVKLNVTEKRWRFLQKIFAGNLMVMKIYLNV